ncbi:formin-like protein 6 isoform X1 [Carex rostrata]
MALFRKFFYRKPPDGLLEISERVYVFDCCFTTDVFEDEKYRTYMGAIVHQLKDHFPDASFMVFNFREGESLSQIAAVLSEYDMTVMDYPRQYEGCPLLSIEMVHHFLRSGESWLSLGQQNIVLMHCERGGWPVLAFMLAALLVYRKQYGAELKTLDMIYKQAPQELLQLICPLNPLPSQLRYLHYISRRNVGSEWPPLDRALTLDCVILRDIPSFNGEGGCRPVFRIYGQDPLPGSDRNPKLLFSTPKRSKLVRLYKQLDCELVKIDIGCHIQGDVVLECINLDGDLVREEMMFRVMFNTAFIRSNILMLNRDDIDILWDAKEQFPKGFRAEVLFSEMDTASNVITTEASSLVEKEGLPMEAFAKVQEFFNDIDWLDHHGAAQHILRKIGSTNSMLERRRSCSPQRELIGQHERLQLEEASAMKPMLEKHNSLPPSTNRRVEVEETSTLSSMPEKCGLHPQHAWDNVELEEKGASGFLQDKRGPLSPLRNVAFPKEGDELDYNNTSGYVQEKYGPVSLKSEPVVPHERVHLDKSSVLGHVQEHKSDFRNEVMSIHWEKVAAESLLDKHSSLSLHEVHLGQTNISTLVLEKTESLSPQTKVGIASDKVQWDESSALNSIQENSALVYPHKEMAIPQVRVLSDEMHAPDHVQEQHISASSRGDFEIGPSMHETMESEEQHKGVFEPVQEYMPVSLLKDEAEVISEQAVRGNKMTAEESVKRVASAEQQKVELKLAQEKHEVVFPHKEGTKGISKHVLPVEKQKRALAVEPDTHELVSPCMDEIDVVPAQIVSNDLQKISQSMQEKGNLVSSDQAATGELGPPVHQDKVVVQKQQTISLDSMQVRHESVSPQKDQEPIQLAENMRPTFPRKEAKLDDGTVDNQTNPSTSIQDEQDASMSKAGTKTASDKELPHSINSSKYVSKEPETTSQKKEPGSPSGSPGSTCISPPADIKSEQQLAKQQPNPKIISQRIPLSRSTPALGITDLLQDHSTVSVGHVQKISVVTAPRPHSPTGIATPKDKVNSIIGPQCLQPPPPPPPPPFPHRLTPLTPGQLISVGSIPVSPQPPSVTKPLPPPSVAPPPQLPSISTPPQLPSISTPPQLPHPSVAPPPPSPLASVTPPPRQPSVAPPPPPPLPPRSSVASPPPPLPPPPSHSAAAAASPPVPPPPPSLSPLFKSTPAKAPAPSPPLSPSLSPLTPPIPTSAHPSLKQSPISTNKPSPSPPPPPPPGTKAPPGPPAPPPPAVPDSPHLRPGGGGPPPPPNGVKAPSFKGKLGFGSRSMQNAQAKKNLKPLHWVKVTRAMQGSLWAEESKQAPVIDMAELECLFSAVVPTSDTKGSADKSGGRSSAPKNEKIHLIDLRKANNCGIMLTKVKMPLSDLMGAILALDDTVLDGDQVENLIKFTPSKEEIELLKDFKGDRESLGECERYFLELMKVPRVESKLRVFSFKIQFRSQISDLGRNLNIVNSCAEEIRGSVKFKRIMQTILSLGNALNQGTARGSAVGFRLDSLLKLSDTRARNNKMTLMHYLCKVLAEKLPELLDFHKDLVSVEQAVKIQLKSLAEEMQAVNKGLEKVEQELSTSESDGPVSDAFRKTLKEFLHGAEADVRALAQLYSTVGRNADALARYFGEDPARCPFEQVVSTIVNFVKMFIKAHEENCKQLELEKKKALKAAENEKLKPSTPTKELSNHPFRSPTKRSNR